MDAAVVPASSTYDALCEEFSVETGALCDALSSEHPALLADHMAKIFPADELLPLIDELGCALQRTPPRPAFFEALREELSASSGDSTATTDGLRLDEAGLRALERVRALTDAHYVDSSAFGIPRAEQDADGELRLGKCRQCDATRLLSSLAEHEAACRPDQAPGRQAPAPASLPAAAEGAPSMSQGNAAPKKRTTQKGSQGRPQKRPRAESAPAGTGLDPPGSLPGSAAPWAPQLPVKRLPPLHPGTATANAAQPASEPPVQHPFVPTSSAPSARPKPVVKLKQPAPAAKSSSPAAALNAAWANFPMPTDFMSEDFGSLPQSMDWLNTADLAAAPASAPAEGAPNPASKAAAKLAAKATAKAAAAAAQKAAAKRAAKKKRALAAAPNPRMGLFQAFTHHPRRKRSASFKRKPRASLKSPIQQTGAFAEVIASLASDSPPPPPQQQRPAQQRPRQRLPAASQAGQGPRMRHPAAHAHASLNALSAMPSLSTPQPPGQEEQAARAHAEPNRPAVQDEHCAQAPQRHAGHPGQVPAGQPEPRQQAAKPYIPQAILQKAQAERSVEPIKAYLRHQQLLRQQLMQQRASSAQQGAQVQEEHPVSNRPPASLLNGQVYSSSQQVPAPANSVILSSSQPTAHRLSGRHLRFGLDATQGSQSSSPSSHPQQSQQAQAQHSAQQQAALRALYLQRTGQPYPAANMPISQAGSPLRRSSTQNPYSGVPMPVPSNPMSAVTTSQGYKHSSSPQLGPFGSPTAMLGSPVSSPQYMQPTAAAPRLSSSQGQTGSGAAHAGHLAVSFGQQFRQLGPHAGQPMVSSGQQQPASQPQHLFTTKQQQSGAPQQYYQAQSEFPAYLSTQNGVLGLPNGVNPLKGSRLGNLPQPEPSQAMRWIPTSVTPPTDKLASMQQLNPMPGTRPEDPVQPMLGQVKFQY